MKCEICKKVYKDESEHLKSLEHRNAMYKDYAFEIENYDKPIEEEANQNPLLPYHKFRLIIIGKSGSGKTTVMLNIIRKIMDNFDVLYICAKNIHEPKYQKLIDDYTKYEDIEKEDIDLICKKLSKKDKKALLEDFQKYKKETVFVSDLSEFITFEDLDETKKNLIVFDDCLLEKDQSLIEQLYLQGRHKNASNIYLAQCYFPIPKVIRDNSNYSPGTQLLWGKTRLNSDLTYKDFSKPVNKVDKAAYNHDVCYLKNKDIKVRNEVCDQNMVKELDDIENPTIRERIERGIVKPIIKAKKMFGMGLSEMIYCVKCKSHTETKDMNQTVSKNNRPMLKGICVQCGSKKCCFLGIGQKKKKKS
ncbi:uncharacterized protein CDAR_317341 [Caerostris darwini]|uniref:C2H2-type domain-containing protein n=1 Tax=Caerostris darwini TaxID=1538125 RepID=A0AAV4V7K6_9ARAC|nr:uncharacterized protein CDAR_317341 [Caerostris darwini]